jgi:hypothetical protein
MLHEDAPKIACINNDKQLLDQLLQHAIPLQNEIAEDLYWQPALLFF